MSDEFKPGDRLVYMGEGKWQKEHFEEAREEVRLAWRDLTVAAAELGASLARFENAMDAFKDTKPYGDRCISMNGNHEQCILAYRHSGRHQFDETHRDTGVVWRDGMGKVIPAGTKHAVAQNPGNGDPMCVCGYEPKEARTQLGAAAMVDRHVRSQAIME